VLCEPVAKKVSFLRTAVRELDLGERVQVEQVRAEELIERGARFEVAMSRATFEPGVWLAIATRLVVPGGLIYVLTVPGSPVAGRVDVYAGGRRALIEVDPGPADG
jgi:16S rRNA G527 N7-methylase RsmG